MPIFVAINVLFWIALGVAAESYPSREIRLVVPYPISGPGDIRGAARATRMYRLMAAHAPPALTDTLGRVVQHALSYESSQPVVLERQAGASTTRGALHVAQSPADGYTLLLGSNATLVLRPHYLSDVGYDPIRDFELVSPLVEMPFVLMASSGLPVKSLERLITYIKVRPGELNYGSSGEASTGYLAVQLLSRAAGLSMVHVPYNGGMAALDGLAKGHITLMYAALPLALSYRGNRYLRELAIASAQRSPLRPDLPTLRESDIQNAEVSGWYAVFAPNGIAQGTVRWVNNRVRAYIDEPATRKVLMDIGLEPAHESLSVFATRIYAEGERWGPVLKAARISPGVSH